MKIEYLLPRPGRYDWNGTIDWTDGATYSELKYTGARRNS
jgi:hypothetical protein